jgi:hypothetical protein
MVRDPATRALVLQAIEEQARTLEQAQLQYIYIEREREREREREGAFYLKTQDGGVPFTIRRAVYPTRALICSSKWLTQLNKTRIVVVARRSHLYKREQCWAVLSTY